MSLNLKYQKIGIKSVGVKTTIPENNLAKLMYYLNCVFVVVQYDENKKFTDYSNYYLLSIEEEQLLLTLVRQFNPKFMRENNLFIVDPNLIPSDMTNEFFQITDERLGFHVNSEILVAGKAVKVKNIMACTEHWISRYYIEPMKGYEQMFINQRNTLLENSSEFVYNNNKDICCKSCCYCICDCCCPDNLWARCCMIIWLLFFIIFISVIVIVFYYD